MSIRMKRVGKALRALYGVAGGVQPAKAGDTCSVGKQIQQVSFMAFKRCGERAHVREGLLLLCKAHMKQFHQPHRA